MPLTRLDAERRSRTGYTRAGGLPQQKSRPAPESVSGGMSPRAAMPQSGAKSNPSVHPESVVLCDRLAVYGVLSCYSVRVLVNVLKVLLVDVRVGV